MGDFVTKEPEYEIRNLPLCQPDPDTTHDMSL